MTKADLIQELIETGYLKTPRIIDAFQNIDRVDFVPEPFKGEAYENYPLSIGEGQTISQPLTVAFMLELLEPKPGEKILDVGAGSGWQTALLAHIVANPRNEGGQKGIVIAVERLQALCDFATRNLEKYKFISNNIIRFHCVDATGGFPDEAPFDKIIAAASARQDIPFEWKKQLKIGGKIVSPIDGSLWLFEKVNETKWEEQEFPGFVFVPLVRG